ncbi:MAG: hypothetical protein E7497_07970 [Ruminococcus sp.]|nr:hypothetical protein [Ruminococcus sp.]MBE6862813.1 hypothetical protein [Ruminococcus sp.]
MYNYNICTEADKNIFSKQCKALEKHIPAITKKEKITDVDGSETQIYTVGDKKITVHNSFYIDAVYIESEIKLEPYFN